jgi:hypothetical protein
VPKKVVVHPMNDEQERALLERLTRIDRRVGIIGFIVIACACGGVAWLAYQFAASEWELGKGLAAFVALVAYGMAAYLMGKSFDK